MPSRYLLRLTERAWDDLGIPPQRRLREFPGSDAITAFLDSGGNAAEFKVLAGFVEHGTQPARLDRGRTISTLRKPMVFRIRSSHYRSAVWWDAEIGVLWLLRALSLADFPDEAHAYDHFAELEQRAKLLPTTDERVSAAGEQYFEDMSSALAEAMQEADGLPERWTTAAIVRPNGSREVVGRCCVTVDEVLRTRHLIVPYEQAPDLAVPSDWRPRLIARCYPADEEVGEAWDDLPEGHDLVDGEMPIRGRRLEDPC